MSDKRNRRRLTGNAVPQARDVRNGVNGADENVQDSVNASGGAVEDIADGTNDRLAEIADSGRAGLTNRPGGSAGAVNNSGKAEWVPYKGRRGVPLALGAVGLLGLAGIQSFVTKGRVEADLRAKSLTKLKDEFPDLKVRFDGRDAYLTGSVTDAESRKRAHDLVRRIKGVRHVEDPKVVSPTPSDVAPEAQVPLSVETTAVAAVDAADDGMASIAAVTGDTVPQQAVATSSVTTAAADTIVSAAPVDSAPIETVPGVVAETAAPTQAPKTLVPSPAVPSPVVPSPVGRTPVVPSTVVPSSVVLNPVVPSASVPSTSVPSTVVPIKVVPSSVVLNPVVPSASVPSTSVPSTSVPSTVVPIKVVPTNVVSSPVVPSTVVPSSVVLNPVVPSTVVPSTVVPNKVVPTTLVPTTLERTTVAPTTLAPRTVVPASVLATSVPTTIVVAPSAIPNLPVTTVVPSGGSVEPIRFGRGSTDLETSSGAEIDRIAAFLNANPNVEIGVAGYADGRGTKLQNLALGKIRARNVKEALIARGVDPARVKAVWFGDRDPVGDNATEEGRAQNRRVEFRFFNAAINAANDYGQDVSFTG